MVIASAEQEPVSSGKAQGEMRKAELEDDGVRGDPLVQLVLDLLSFGAIVDVRTPGGTGAGGELLPAFRGRKRSYGRGTMTRAALSAGRPRRRPCLRGRKGGSAQERVTWGTELKT